MPDYSKGIIYKLCCKDPTIKDIYIGSTCNFTKRKYEHKQSCINSNNKEYNIYKNVFIRENGGWDNWDMIMIKEYPCENKRELVTEERKCIEEYNASLNKILPSRSKKELEEYKKEYRIKNKDYHKEYYIKNKDKLKDYREKNKEKISKRQKEYREKNRDKIFRKIKCECGSIITKHSLNRHLKSKKHQLSFLSFMLS